MSTTIPSLSREESNPLRGTRYRALRRLGWGAATEVFEAEGPGGETVAVKILRPGHVAEHEYAARLVHEATALTAIDHPNVVRLLDCGSIDERRPFFVMPRLLGESLRDRLRHAAVLDAPRACELIAGALDGLAAAHRLGIVHRDVKPANLLLACGLPGAAGERAVVIDFGIAKIAASSLEPLTGAHVIGTPRYLAPEQIVGAPADARTDVYAAGLVLFEAIAGAPPFDARDPFGHMRAHISVEARSLRRAADGVPRALDRIVAKALAMRPDARFAGAADFAAALRDVDFGVQPARPACLSKTLDRRGCAGSAGAWSHA